MPCHLIAEIHHFVLNEHAGPYLNTEIKTLGIAGIAPSYAAELTISDINRLRQCGKKPLLLPSQYSTVAREEDLRLATTSQPHLTTRSIHFLEQESASNSFTHSTEVLAKDDCSCLLEWLTKGEEGDNVAIIVPYAILPVVAALKSIHSLDPYLSTHYLQQLKPLLPMLSIPLQQEICRLKLIQSEELNLMGDTVSPSAERYIRLERKLHRKYREH